MDVYKFYLRTYALARIGALAAYHYPGIAKDDNSNTVEHFAAFAIAIADATVGEKSYPQQKYAFELTLATRK